MNVRENSHKILLCSGFHHQETSDKGLVLSCGKTLSSSSAAQRLGSEFSSLISLQVSFESLLLQFVKIKTRVLNPCALAQLVECPSKVYLWYNSTDVGSNHERDKSSMTTLP